MEVRRVWRLETHACPPEGDCFRGIAATQAGGKRIWTST